MGIVAVLDGVGGGAICPIISVFSRSILILLEARYPRGFVSRLGYRTRIVKKGMADLRLSMPVALIASSCAIVGAMVACASD
jgi:hypothetical protein